MDWKFLIFVGFSGFFGNFVLSCQPPPYGLYNNYNPAQYSASNVDQSNYNYNQIQNPNPNQNPIPQAIHYNPTIYETSTSFPFLQDNSIDSINNVNSFPTNPVIRISSPPSDPPTNPFLADKIKSLKESENISEDSTKLADECAKNGVETLENFRKCTESYAYGLGPEHSQFGSDKCDFEPEFVCRFYSDTSELLSFKSGQFRILPKENRIFQETFAILTKRPVNNLPNRSFIFVDGHDVTENSVAILKTDILCQKGDGKLSFDYWTTKSDVTLKVCTRTDRERSCTQDITYDTETSKVEIDVIHPIENKFVLEIVVANFIQPSVFILDNLEYEAELCEDGLFNTDSSVLTTTAPNFQLNQQRNAVAFGSQLKPNSFPIQNEGFQPLNQAEYVQPPKNLQQNWQFLQGTQQSFQQSSKPFPQPPQSPASQPKAQFLQPSQPPILSKKTENSQFLPPKQPLPNLKQKIVPPVGQATNLNVKNDGILFVQNRYSQSPKQNVISKGIKKVSSCELIQCNFETNFCKWFQPQMSSEGVRYGNWQISRSQVGNPLTGIKTNANDHGGFAFVGMDHHTAKVKGRTVFILESPSFTLDADTLLSFDLYRRSNAITLQVCLDSLLNCPYEAPPLQTLTYWKEGESLIMPKTTRKIYFVATQWKRFKWLAIDNVVVNKGRGCHGLEALKKRPQ